MSIENKNSHDWDGIGKTFKYEPFSEYIKKKSLGYDVKFLFEENRVLQNEICRITGLDKEKSEKIYEAYLNSLFPESHVKEILWHAGSQTIEVPNKEKFSYSANIGSSKLNPTRSGFFASNAKELNLASIEGSVLHAVMFNIKDPDHGDFSVHPAIIARDFTKDSAIIDYGGGCKFYAVFNPEQIHILGSPTDIVHFKEFVSIQQP